MPNSGDNAPAGCYVCGAANISLAQEVDGFSIYRCHSCSLLWVGNFPADYHLEDYYNQDYYASDSKIGYQDYLGDERNHRRNARRLLRWTSHFQPLRGANLLDFGCGFGFLLDEAQKSYHCRGVGLEISRQAASFAREHLGLEVHGDDSWEAFPPDFFDVAMVIGTIEHLTHPIRVLREIARVLKPGGHLVITTIDTQGLLPFYSLKPPEHLFYFSHRNLYLLLQQTGFSPLFRRTYFVNYRVHDLFNRFGKFLSADLLCKVSKALARLLPDFSLPIPTNEIMVIARRVGSGTGKGRL